MKTLAASLFAITLLLAPILAPAAETTYVGKLKGIDCADCKRTISRALGKIKGVKTIRITKESKEVHQLTVVTDGTKSISRAEAVAALGKDSHYQIISWN